MNSLQIEEGKSLYHFTRPIELISAHTSNIKDIVFLNDIVHRFPTLRKHIAEHVFHRGDRTENLLLWSSAFETGAGNYSSYDLMSSLVKSAKFTLVNRYEKSLVDPEGSCAVPFEKRVKELMEKVTSGTREL